MKSERPNDLARALHDFFSDHLPRLRGMSPHTVLSYRDSLRLLLCFVASSREVSVSDLDVEHIGAPEVIAFLGHLEQVRDNTAATRNIRLAAIHAFFRFLSARDPGRLEQCQRILGVPFKRAHTRPIAYLEYDEIKAVLDAVDRAAPDGQRDYALLATMFNTGARVQEVLDLRVADLQLQKPFQARLVGKGRKERICPLWPQTARVLREWLEHRHIDLRSTERLFLNHRREPLTRFGVRYILAKYCALAQPAAAGLIGKRLHPHSMRHTTAVHLLKAGVDLSTISQWLGHTSVTTTNRYATVDLDMKRKAIAKATPLAASPSTASTWRTKASILKWLEAL
jgi:site-specific recombinase XerD